MLNWSFKTKMQSKGYSCAGGDRYYKIQYEASSSLEMFDCLFWWRRVFVQVCLFRYWVFFFNTLSGATMAF